ncbi:hypothetical protein TNCV_4859731 [Trichonephila clavipes]|nr:hypothetical protein TNCV_4859731 [Trichonephila clavipes]
MQRDCALRIAGRGRLTSFSVYKTGNQSLFECTELFTKEELRQVARQLGRSDWVVRRCWSSGSDKCHLHEDQAQDALDRPLIEKTATS